MKNFFIVLILIVAFIFAGLFILGVNHDAMPISNNMPATLPNDSASTSPTHNTDDSIEVISPKPNTLIQSPLHITGEAKNPWYFEGQFPAELIDSAGTVLAKAPALAGGDWTAPGFIPFSLTFNFPAPTTTTGLLIFRNDNPSGDPSRDIILAIPVRFR